ncbi:alpha-N-acetylgalactosaminidase [Flavobacteriaceae bacterium UJ101]|nr:alpha-N-acetylgalactosaminidase [Flavobacteriaceae bacterium UJ101]
MEKTRKVILFDGVCNLCNGFVQFVIERDEEKVFQFASLQSDFGQQFLEKHSLNTQEFDSFILLEGEEYFTESTAGLKVLSQLKGFSFARFFLYLPSFLRNLAYKLIAKNRYTLFGKADTCWLPTPELKERFL